MLVRTCMILACSWLVLPHYPLASNVKRIWMMSVFCFLLLNICDGLLSFIMHSLDWEGANVNWTKVIIILCPTQKDGDLGRAKDVNAPPHKKKQ